MADFGGMLKDPATLAMMKSMANQRQGGGGMEGMKKPSNPLSNLADAYPKLKEQADKMKIEEAERKAKKLKFDYIYKKAEEQFKLREGQQKIDSARNSV